MMGGRHAGAVTFAFGGASYPMWPRCACGELRQDVGVIRRAEARRRKRSRRRVNEDTRGCLFTKLSHLDMELAVKFDRATQHSQSSVQ